MTTLTIRKSGGANVVSIPKAILKSLGLSVGSVIDLSIIDHKIVLAPAAEEMTLESLIAASPEGSLRPLPEDKKWLNRPSVGREFL